jgi:hypothetical protein
VSSGIRPRRPPRSGPSRRDVALPRFVSPQLSQPVEKPPSGPQWLLEIKLDGSRMAARIDRGRAQLLTRTGLDWTDKYPSGRIGRRNTFGVSVKVPSRENVGSLNPCRIRGGATIGDHVWAIGELLMACLGNAPISRTKVHRRFKVIDDRGKTNYCMRTILFESCIN